MVALVVMEEMVELLVEEVQEQMVMVRQVAPEVLVLVLMLVDF